MKVKPLLPEQPVTTDGKRGSLVFLEIVQRIIRAIEGKADLAGATMTGPLVTVAPDVAAGLLLTPGASDPSSPTDGEIWRRTADLRARIGGTNYTFAMNNGASTFTGKKTFAASTTGGAFLNLAPGVAPSAPVDGDIWVETTGVYAHVNGVTVLLG